MKRAVLVIVVLGVVAALAVWAFKPGMFRKEDPNLIKLSGNIELTQVDISFKAPGRLVELNVDEGSAVKKGTLIARLDKETLESQRDREQAGLKSASAQLAQAHTAVEYQRAAVDSDVALRRADLKSAEARLRELEAGSRPQEIEQAKAQVRDARSWNEQAKQDWDRAQQLFKDEDISRAQYDQFRARFESTSATLRQAEERLQLSQEGTRKEVIEAARAQVERARAAVAGGEANRIEIRRREQELTVRNAEIDRARAQVAVTQTQLGDTSAVAPLDGVVLVKSAELGEVLPAGAVVVTIGDLAHPWMRGYVSEKDLGRVKIGTKVKLTTDSYPGKVYWGRITYIASEAEFTPKQIQTQDERVKLVYRVKIEVDNPEQELKSNMPVDAEIVL